MIKIICAIILVLCSLAMIASAIYAEVIERRYNKEIKEIAKAMEYQTRRELKR